MADTIGLEQIRKAEEIRKKYASGRAQLEARLLAENEWYRLRHWEMMTGQKSQVEPKSAWLFNSLLNKHADAMDNFPSANVLPREEGDKQEAEQLSHILPVVLDQTEFEAVYSDVTHDKNQHGCGIYGIFWDADRRNGLGDVVIKNMDALRMYWEPGIDDIQESSNVFVLDLVDNDFLTAEYPELENKLGSDGGMVKQYLGDDGADVTNKSCVVDWYYKKRTEGRTVLHYCKYVGDYVIFATENEKEYAERGWYDDGDYPFVFDNLFPIKHSPFGFGYIAVGMSDQEYIDRTDQLIQKNVQVCARKRYFIRHDGSVKTEEYADLTKDFVNVDGQLGQDSILPIVESPLPSFVLTVRDRKIEELKETTGNRDVSNGGSTSGVTAASAIAAMQEAGGKLSRDSVKASYRAFRKLVLMVIERIRQFYDAGRTFRILGADGQMEFVQYSNEGLQPQSLGSIGNEDMGYRLPLFDLEITAQKASSYSKMAQNELALQFYSAGFFNPQNADQALACLNMMDFDRKSEVIKTVSQNMTMMQMIQQLQSTVAGMASELDRIKGTNLAPQMMQQMQGGMAQGIPGQPVSGAAEGQEALGGSSFGESSVTKGARQQAAEASAPR